MHEDIINMKTIKKNIFSLTCLMFLFTNCSFKQDMLLESTLDLAYENKQELEIVLEHYQDDPEKLRAAQFIIKNMIGKQVIDSSSIKNMQPFYDALTNHHKKYGGYDNDVQYSICDSIKRLYPNTAIFPRYLPDIQKLSSDFLIRHIDRSFQIWRQYPWCKDIDTETFHKYILPYTTSNYYWEQALDFFDRKYAILRDTAQNKSNTEVSELIIHHIDTTFLREWPIYDEEYKELLPTTFQNIAAAQMGSCLENNIYQIAALRANGIPAVLNTHPGWGNFGYTHFWTEIINDKPVKKLYDNTQRPYTSKDDMLISDMFWVNTYSPAVKDLPPFISLNYCRTVPKVYRLNYEIQKNSLALIAQEEIPALFKDPGIEDITDKYIVCKDIKVPLWNDQHPQKHIYLYCYDVGKWNPVCWSVAEKKQASFHKMGVNILYLPAFYDNGAMIPAGDAFILTAEGEFRFLSPKTTEKENIATFYTKMPYRLHTAIKATGTIGTQFYMCNNSDLSDSTLVHTINKQPFYIDSFNITGNTKYRYMICDFQNVSSLCEPFCIAEIKVFGKDNKLIKGNWTGTKNLRKYKIENISDGSRVSFYQPDKSDKQQRIIFDMTQGHEIGKVEFYPRSDDNRIVTGELYELFYWDGKWISLGRQQAEDYKLVYHNIPKNALFMIHNHTQGKEHRPFTYENGKQVWW